MNSNGESYVPFEQKMTGVTIPQEWSQYVSSSFNRIFISPASGCSANCAYCFIFEYGHPHRPQVFEIPPSRIAAWLQSEPLFRAGKSGTLLSLAPFCDAFAPEVTDTTLEFVRALAPLKNPIQLSTKYYVDETTAKKLGDLQDVAGQIVLYVTITSFKLWRQLEPATDAPSLRLKGSLNVRHYGINTCLSIKPVLPGITELEAESFAKAIGDYRIPFCALGVMYSSKNIEVRMRARRMISSDLECRLRAAGRIPPPPHSYEQGLRAWDIPTLDIAQKLLLTMKAAGAECVVSGPCAIALSYDVLCPTGVWRYLPHLCVPCQANCRSRFAESSSVVRAPFLSENPYAQPVGG